MTYYAVVDTNALVSALLSKKSDAATVLVFKMIFSGEIIPLYSVDTMSEYREVLNRKKFKFDSNMIDYILSAIEKFGILVQPNPSGITLPDIKDLPFYEIVMERKDDDPYLITGNIKHFTSEKFIVTPAEFIAIVKRQQ